MRLCRWQNGAVTQFYEGGALRRSGCATDNGVFYVVSDHLRSTSVLVNRDSTVKGPQPATTLRRQPQRRCVQRRDDETLFTGQYHGRGCPAGRARATTTPGGTMRRWACSSVRTPLCRVHWRRRRLNR